MTERGFDLADRVAARHDTDLYRDIAPVDRVAERSYFAPDPGRDLPVLDGEEHLVFAANNYLGLTQHDRVQEAAAQAADVVGTGAGASRLVTGDTLVHRDLELRLAEVKGTDRALAFSSGYAANVGTIAALDPDVVFSDEFNHASIVDGCRLSGADVVVYDHRDAGDLRRRMAARAESSEHTASGGPPSSTDGGEDESWLVVTDSVFSMDGTVAPLEALCDAVESFGAWLMVDEAHATGLHVDGGGIVQREGLEERVHVQMGTLSKALASQGGYVAGSESLIEHLVNEARSFVFSTGLAPPAAAAASEALHLARHGECRDRLWSNVGQLRNGLESVGYEVWGDTQVLPIVVGDRLDALALERAVRERGIVAPAIRPPTVPEGTSRIRIAPMATHSRSDVEHCIEAFRAAGEEVGLL
ncbi:aminotransferase class I/II-fold pyridoxal phosphate-dependent enzyme [Haloarchaeobius litoreus]|uniref:8-amino-7-oxononanoate synthase n=1 Tax=Haloarchaeobius litoreus TaxID=755306 RepID=A0ABD6DM69_9EURY|nr:8-amino-7-oxononanoate synthase [Haloarchaeobius litoreus]